MSRYTIAREAREDLKEIYRYIARDNPSAAGRLRQIFFEKFRLLAEQPLIGEVRNDLAENLRMFSAGNYVVLYRPTGRLPRRPLNVPRRPGRWTFRPWPRRDGGGRRGYGRLRASSPGRA